MAVADGDGRRVREKLGLLSSNLVFFNREKNDALLDAQFIACNDMSEEIEYSLINRLTKRYTTLPYVNIEIDKLFWGLVIRRSVNIIDDFWTKIKYQDGNTKYEYYIVSKIDKKLLDKNAKEIMELFANHNQPLNIETQKFLNMLLNLEQ